MKNIYIIITIFSLMISLPKAFSQRKSISIINFTGDNGYRHSSQQAGIKMIEDMGKENGWKIISTNDPNVFTKKILKTIDLILFNNNCGNKGPIFNKAQQIEIQKFIANGGGFAGIHCAGAVWCEDNVFQSWYEDLIGARMVNHPAVQPAIMKIETKNYLATAHLPAFWKLTEEYHTFNKNPRDHAKVLISVDEDSYSGEPKMHGDHPMVWCRQFGKSRVFFSALGHSEEIYSNIEYQKMILGGLVWAMKLDDLMNRASTELPVKSGLVVDLNADKGIFADDSTQVFRWENQVQDSKVRFFEKRDEGRKIPGSGCPILRKRVSEINGHNSLVFREQELVNDQEDVFDHLITGSGYTFFCIVAPYRQIGKVKDVNSFFGNLRNGGKYEGIWGGFTDDNRIWSAPRNGLSFGRWDSNNPFICSTDSVKTNHFCLVVGKMEAGTDSALVRLNVNQWNEKDLSQKIKINKFSNSSKFAIGQERDAIQHPGLESFDGEIARFLLYDRPLKSMEIRKVITSLRNYYKIGN